MANTRGNGDTIDQTQERLLSGAESAEQLVTTTMTTKTDNHLAIWVAGNLLDGGIPISGLTSSPPTPLLDSTTGLPITTDAGEWIFPG
jgi:hypothetical protein